MSKKIKNNLIEFTELPLQDKKKQVYTKYDVTTNREHLSTKEREPANSGTTGKPKQAVYNLKQPTFADKKKNENNVSHKRPYEISKQQQTINFCLKKKELQCVIKPDRRHVIRNNPDYSDLFLKARGMKYKQTYINKVAGVVEVSPMSTTHSYDKPSKPGLLCSRLLPIIIAFVVRKQKKKSSLTSTTWQPGLLQIIPTQLYGVSCSTASWTGYAKIFRNEYTQLTYLPQLTQKLHLSKSLADYSRSKLKKYLQPRIRNIQVRNPAIKCIPHLLVKTKNALRSKSFWLNQYTFSVLQPLLGRNITVINYNILSAATHSNYKKITKSALSAFPFLQLNRVAAHFIATIYTALILKETKALTLFIKKLMREVHFKKHPFYFTFVGSLIRDSIQPQLHKFNCLGLSVVFRGKLGIGGNARKRSLKYQTGMISSSSKYVKLSRSIDVVRTKTGIVGFTVILAW